MASHIQDIGGKLSSCEQIRNKKIVYLFTGAWCSRVSVEIYGQFFQFLYLFSRNKVFPYIVCGIIISFQPVTELSFAYNSLSIYFHYKNNPVKQYRRNCFLRLRNLGQKFNFYSKKANSSKDNKYFTIQGMLSKLSSCKKYRNEKKCLYWLCIYPFLSSFEFKSVEAYLF